MFYDVNAVDPDSTPDGRLAGPHYDSVVINRSSTGIRPVTAHRLPRTMLRSACQRLTQTHPSIRPNSRAPKLAHPVIIDHLNELNVTAVGDASA